jgi:hypothetical protein
MTRHLSVCPERRAAIAEADQGSAPVEQLYHLQVRDGRRADYWLHLEMDGSATLEELDYYLRRIWLECCGHPSHFSTGPGWGEWKIDESASATWAFEVGQQITHIYDYGTTSTTLIRVKDVRRGRPLTKHPIVLMARNTPPRILCMECDAPATWLCIECMFGEDKSGFLCDQHAAVHPHEDYGDPVPVVNSPRVGMCAYCGPAEPPY